MNGVDVTDVTRNVTSDEWDKLHGCGGHTYVYQRRDYLSGRGGRGGRSNRGGRRGGYGGRDPHAGRHNDQPEENRNISAANVTNNAATDIVEYDASTSTIASHSIESGGRGGPRTGGCFRPRRAID